MKFKYIYDQLITYLPLKTDLFSNIIAVSSFAYAASTVTVTTATAHGLITGNIVTVKGALEQNQITSLTSSDGVATAVTTNNHDLTTGYQETVNISGADQAEYNGDKTLVSVIDEKTFTFSIEGTPVSPATGTIYLNEDLAFGYNGTFSVTVINTTTFTYAVIRDLGIENGSPNLSTSPRIFSGNNIDRIITAYTKQSPSDYVLFINLGLTRSSRDRQTDTDASYEYTWGDYRQHLIQEINLYVFAPTTETVNAGVVRDTFEDLRFDFIGTLCGAKLDSGSSDTDRRALTYLEDDLELYNGAFLIHRYSFEVVYDITTSDVFVPNESVVIKELGINYSNEFDEIIKADKKDF